jgi:hypothetical protein
MRGAPINATEFQHKLFESGLEPMKKGFAGTFAQLDEYLAAGKTGSVS